RLAIDLARDRVVDDVTTLESLVLLLQPGIDPEALDADDLFLLVAHRAGNVHHVDNDGVGDRLGLGLPAPEALVARNGHDDRVRRRVGARRDLALERLAVGPPEVPERVGPPPPSPGDRRELIERDVPLERVVPRRRPPLPALALFSVGIAAHRIAGIAFALPRSPALAVAEREVRDVDLRDRDRDDVFAVTTDQLALRDVLAQVLPDPAADDRAEARVILVDLQGHRFRSLTPLGNLCSLCL